MIQILAILHVLATCAMATIVSFVHIVQYPLLREIPTESLPKYEGAYTQRAGYIIAPLMLLEAGSAVSLLVLLQSHGALLSLNVALLVFIWVVTFFVSVPAHEGLTRGWNEAVHDRLMWSNGLRLIAWLVRLPVAFVILGESGAG